MLRRDGRVEIFLLLLAACLVFSPGVADESCRWQLRLSVGLAADKIDESADSRLETLYRSRGWSLLWHERGAPTAQARELMRRLVNADQDGLNPKDYGALRGLEGLARPDYAEAGEVPCSVWQADLDLSRAGLAYITDLRLGRVDPRSLGMHLDAEPRQADFTGILARLSQASDPAAFLDAIHPPFRRYWALMEALQRYQLLARDARLARPLPWAGQSVHPNDPYPALEELTYKLRRLGDLTAGEKAPQEVYSGALVEAVRHFQARHGLARDGIIGHRTIAALNVAPATRMRQILMSLERWRWLPDDLGHRPVIINIPEFRLYAFENTSDGGYELALTMKVIVGESISRNQTPVFRGEMSYVVFAPYWNVPNAILRRELAPRIKNDPEYLAANHFEIVPSHLPNERPLPVNSENMERLLKGELKLRQAPCPNNPLGVAKFIFPNEHAVYMHGTPEQGLFVKWRRDFSHGCIRIADAPRLAAHVLAQERGWDRARVVTVIASGERRQVNLSKPLAVFVLYDTAVAQTDGTVRFFADIYGHDQRLARALDRRSH